MPRAKKHAGHVRLNVFLPRELADAVTRYAGHLQTESGKFVSMGDVISLAVEAYGPLTKKRRTWARKSEGREESSR